LLTGWSDSNAVCKDHTRRNRQLYRPIRGSAALLADYRRRWEFDWHVPMTSSSLQSPYPTDVVKGRISSRRTKSVASFLCCTTSPTTANDQLQLTDLLRRRSRDCRLRPSSSSSCWQLHLLWSAVVSQNVNYRKPNLRVLLRRKLNASRTACVQR